MKGSWSVQPTFDHLPPSSRGEDLTQLKSKEGQKQYFMLWVVT
jgi:hypothetical protein